MFLRAIGRPLLAKVKQTTGIVGLDVVPNARAVLIDLYSKTLKEIQAVPEDEGYRKAVESFTRHRLNVCKEEEDWEAIEKRLGCGQVEELIEEAQDELTLIGKMIGALRFEIRVLLLGFFIGYQAKLSGLRKCGTVYVSLSRRSSYCLSSHHILVFNFNVSSLSAIKQVERNLGHILVLFYVTELTFNGSPNLGTLNDYECEVIENDAPIPKHVPQHRPGPLPEDFYRTLEGLISDSKTKIPAAATTSTDPQLKE
ncbi:hypothetical protein Bca101_017166 [Brassica carinata]